MNKESRYAYVTIQIILTRQNHQCLQIRIKDLLKPMPPTLLVFPKKPPTSKLNQIKHLFQVNYLKLRKRKPRMTYSVTLKSFKIFFKLKSTRGKGFITNQRYRYLVKNGTIKKIENGGNIIFSEL